MERFPSGNIGNPINISLALLLDRTASHTREKYGKKAANLYLVAGRAIKNRPAREWFNTEYLINGVKIPQWHQPRLLHWNKLYAEYEKDGFTVHLYGTGNSFGEELDLEVMYEARSTLEEKLQQTFSVEPIYHVLRSTPALTGKELLLISLPKGKQYPCLLDAMLDLLSHNFGQARMETFPPQRRVLENGVYLLDARWMYASCVSHLPTGPCYHDDRNEFLGTITSTGRPYPTCPGFYRITAEVPKNWHHIGLLKSSDSKTITDDSGHYPRTPGETFTNWTTASELALALHHHWHIQIHERMLWPHELTDPLATWRKHLVKLREQIEQELEKKYSKASDLHKDAIRSILLHTIGSFHQYTTFVDHVTARKDFGPAPRPLDQYLSPTRGHWKAWRLPSKNTYQGLGTGLTTAQR